MKAIVVSDLHIGSTHFEPRKFTSFLETAPSYDLLILNGDIAHNFGRDMAGEHARVIEHIGRISRSRQVVWVAGNHDRGYRPPLPENIEFAESYGIGNQLFAFHGDRILPMKRVFGLISAIMKPVLLRIDTQHVSVRLAKAVPFLFRYLGARLMANAVKIAADGGYNAVTCGHIHSTMDSTSNGIRYVNTGTWTDSTAPYLLLENNRLSLCEFA
jgi:UDP-2,3-diacylglucosamine pyrophosphatase LpxH